MEAMILDAIAVAVVTLLGGERVVSGVRARRNGNSFATKSDLDSLLSVIQQGNYATKDDVDGAVAPVLTSVNLLGQKLEHHLGYHEGLRGTMRRLDPESRGE